MTTANTPAADDRSPLALARVAARASLATGRKFTPADISQDTPAYSDILRQAALDYARSYAKEPPFGYMLSMKHQANRAGRLSDAQTAGVLNCIRREEEDNQKTAERAFVAEDKAMGAPLLATPTSATVDALNTNLNRLLDGMRQIGATEAGAPDANGVRTLKDAAGATIGTASPGPAPIALPTAFTRAWTGSLMAVPQEPAPEPAQDPPLTPAPTGLNNNAYTWGQPPTPAPAPEPAADSLSLVCKLAPHWDRAERGRTQVLQVQQPSGKWYGVAFVRDGKTYLWRRYQNDSTLARAVAAWEEAETTERGSN